MSDLPIIPVHGIQVPIKPDFTSANTLKNRIKEYMAYKEGTGVRPKSLEAFQRALDLMEVFFGEHSFTAKSFATLDMWLMKNYKLSAKSTHVYMEHMLGFLWWCKRSQYIDRHTFWDIREAIQLPKVPTPDRPKIFTYDEYLKLRKAAAGLPYDWAFVLAYHTGLSLVDCCHLRWANVDLETMWIRVARIKLMRYGAKAISELPIIAETDLHVELVKLYAQYQLGKDTRTEEEADYVHPELMKLYSWKDSNIRQTMSRFLRKHLGTRKIFHTFRHTFVSNVTNSGMPTALACKLTAHQNPQMLMRYLHVDKQALREGVEKALEYAKAKPKGTT